MHRLCHHIFSLFEDHPEFYATYYMMNEKSYYKYSDKMRVSVLDLTRQDLATEEDKSYELNLWASFFKAKTWEELISLADQSDALKQAASTAYVISQEEFMLRECLARESWLKGQARIHREIEQYKSEIEQHKSEIEQHKSETEQYKSEIAYLRSLLFEHGINPDT